MIKKPSSNHPKYWFEALNVISMDQCEYAVGGPDNVVLN